MTRSAREVVELYNFVVWNERDFALADELMGTRSFATTSARRTPSPTSRR